jgi:hypothetical protein
MTDAPQSPIISPDWEASQAQERERARLAAEALPLNKTALFDALTAAGITSVTVRFDGYGDSGQIEEVSVEANGAAATLPAATITIAQPSSDSSRLDRTSLPVAEAIETLAYGFLTDTHEGWPNNEGAFGDFVFDVAKRTITLDYNERFMESENFQHSF